MIAGTSSNCTFPDGNATIARLLVRNLIPAAVPGDSVADVITARVNYALLVGARPRTKGMERKDLLEANGAIFSSANQGGILRLTTAVLIAFAQGRASL